MTNPPALPLNHTRAAMALTQLVEQLGYKIFLSGGAAASLQGTSRKVKDLDFRIVLGFSFLSANGQLFISELNRLVKALDAGTPFEIHDRQFGRTIMSKCFLNVEASISNTVLPQFGEFQQHQDQKWNDEHRATPIDIMGVDDIIFDKLISVIFRREFAKLQTDASDLLELLLLSGKEPLEFVKQLFLRRGAAYAFSSKPADLDRMAKDVSKLRQGGAKDSDKQAAERRAKQVQVKKAELTQQFAALASNPQEAMLLDLLNALEEIKEEVKLKSKEAKMLASLILAVQSEIKLAASQLSLLQVTSQCAIGNGVKASLSRGVEKDGKFVRPSWEV